MTKDRTQEFRNNSDDDVSRNGLTNRPSTTALITVESDPVTEFLKKVHILTETISKLEQLIKEVRVTHGALLQIENNPKLGPQLDEKQEIIKQLTNEIRVKLEQLKNEHEEHHNSQYEIVFWRMRESQIFVLTKRFHGAMTQYNQDAISYREQCKNIIVRELNLSGNRKSNDEIEDILENGSPGSYSFSILVETQQARQTLNAIEARHRDILKIEQNVRELHELFQDLAALVDRQGDMIDSIAYNISMTKEDIEKAVPLLDDAVKNEKKANKKKGVVFIILCVTLVLVCIIIVIGVSAGTLFRKL